MNNLADLQSEIKSYRAVDVINYGDLNAREPEDRHPFVTVALKPEDDKELFSSGRVDPFVVIIGDKNNRSSMAKYKKINECWDPDTKKYDPDKLWNLGKFRGVFGSFPVAPYWQQETDAEGRTVTRKYRKGHPDEGKPIPAQSVTLFIWENDVIGGNAQSAINAAVGRRPAVTFADTEEYEYQSATPAEVLRNVKASATKADKEAAKEK